MVNGMSDLNNIFGIHEQALLLRSKRNELIAANIANADTPGYKAQDINFQKLLSKQVSSQEVLTTTNPSHIRAGARSQGIPEVIFRRPVQPSLDGNTVSVDYEKAEFAKNAIGYQAAVSFISGEIKDMLTAIKGE